MSAPEPFFERTFESGGRGVLYCGDMRELVPRLFPCRSREGSSAEGSSAEGQPEGGGPFGRPDLIFADPPYGQTSTEWDTWPDGWPAVAARAVKKTGSMWCCGTARMLFRWGGALSAAGWHFGHEVVWEKHNGAGLRTDRFRAIHENVYHFYRDDARWGNVYKNVQREETSAPPPSARNTKPGHFGGENRYVPTGRKKRLKQSIIYARSMQGRALNKTQKPGRLLLPLIEYGCPPGGLILAPFSGAGTAIDVARRTGRTCVAIEKRPRQCERAVERLSQRAMALQQKR